MSINKNICVRWTEIELSIITADYPTTNTALLAEQLGRTAMAVRVQAKKMGIAKAPYFNNYTAEKALPAVDRSKPEKDLEKKGGLASKLRELPFMHPLRRAYDRATPAGSPAGSAPRTMSQLQALIR